jgi:AraC-like DNA-binding protein
MTASAQQQEPPVSRPMHHPQRLANADGAQRGRSKLFRPARHVPTHPLLAEIIEEIVDWDVPDGDVVRALATKALPSTCPYLIVQYRVPIRTYRYFGSTSFPHVRYYHVATMVGTGHVKLRASDPLGAVMVRLKPEGAARLIGERMREFMDTKIDLGGIFDAGEVSLLEEMLMEASDSATRFACIESFLLRNLRQRQPNPVVCRAAQFLRRNPSLRVRWLAAQLDVGERHLSRGFRAMFGASPKQFARVARIQKILAMRQGGSAWADIAYACGFADQAHMINEFDAIVGEPPQQLFRRTALDREGNTTIGPDFFEHAP